MDLHEESTELINYYEEMVLYLFNNVQNDEYFWVNKNSSILIHISFNFRVGPSNEFSPYTPYFPLLS